jgi:hypothetical protein
MERIWFILKWLGQLLAPEVVEKKCSLSNGVIQGVRCSSLEHLKMYFEAQG